MTARSPALAGPSPLPAIRDLERTGAERLAAARARAEAAVAVARAAAEASVVAARRDAVAEADRAHRAGVTRARREARAIETQAREGVEAFVARASAQLEEAADAIVTFVLPPAEPEGGA